MVANALILSPIRFAASSYVVRIDTGAPTDVTVNVTAGRDYWVSGDGQLDDAGGDGDLLAVLAAALPSGLTVSKTAAHRVQISASTGTVQVLWDHANTTLPKAVFGFSGDTAAAAVVTGDRLPQGIFVPETPTGFGRDLPTVMAGLDRSLAGDVAASFFGEGFKERKIRFPALEDRKVRAEAASAAEPYGTLGTLWTGTLARGRRFRLYEDEADPSHAIYKATRIAEPYEQHPAHPFYWQAQIDAVRLATWSPSEVIAAPFTDWLVGYSAEDTAGIGPYTWDPELGTGPQLSRFAGAFTQGVVTAPMQDVGVGADRVDGAVRFEANGFWAARLDSFPAGVPIHVRCVFKPEAEANGYLFAYVVNGLELFQARYAGAQLQLTWRNDSAGGLFGANVNTTDDAWHLLDVIIDPAGGAGGNASMTVYLNGADVSPADHTAPLSVATSGQLGLGSWVNGTGVIAGSFLWWGLRPGTGMSLALHQAHRTGLGV